MSEDQPEASTGDEIKRLLAVLEDLERQDREECILGKTYAAMKVHEDASEAQAVRNRLEEYGDDYLADLAVALYFDDAGERARYLATVDPNPDRAAYFNHRAEGCEWAANDLRNGFNQPARRAELDPPINREEAIKMGRQAAVRKS